MANPLYGQNKLDAKLNALAAAYDSTSTLLSKNVRQLVVHNADFDTVANDDVIGAIPADSLITNVIVINSNAGALDVGTSLHIEAGAGGTALTDDIKALAATTAYGGTDEDADLPYFWAAGGNLVWALGGTNSTGDAVAVTVIVEYIPAVTSIS
jgi:hypothetical protein